MKYALTLTALAMSTSAFAHPGHIETVAGHDHINWLAALGLIVAGVVIAGVRFASKRRAR